MKNNNAPTSPDPSAGSWRGDRDTTPGTPGTPNRFFLKPPGFSTGRKSGNGSSSSLTIDDELQLTPLTTQNPNFTKRISIDEGDGYSNSSPWYRRTRKRRLLCVGIPAVIMMMGVFFAVRVSQALPMLQAEPLINKFEVGDMCGKVVPFNVSGTIDNPGAIGALLVPSDFSVLATADGELGRIAAEPFQLNPGNQTFTMTGTLIVCDTCLDAWKGSIQRWFDGEEVGWELSLEISAEFDPSAFLVPISFGTTLNIGRQIPSYVSDDPNAPPSKDINGNVINRFQYLGLPTVEDPETQVALRLGFDLRSDYSPDSYDIRVPLPPVKFVAFINDEEAGVGNIDPWLFGGPFMDNLYVTATGVESNVGALQQAIVAFAEGKDFKYSVSGRATEEERKACYAQEVIEGLVFWNTLSLSGDDEAEEDSESPSGFGVGISSTQLVDIQTAEEGSKTSLAMDFDLSDLASWLWFSLDGTLPTLGVSLSLNSTETEARDKLGTIEASNLAFYDGQTELSKVDLDILMANASLVLRGLEQGLNSRADNAFVYARTVSDESRYGLLSTVLSAWEFEFDLFSTLSGDENGSSLKPEDGVFDSIGNLSLIANENDLSAMGMIEFVKLFGTETHASWDSLEIDLAVKQDDGTGTSQSPEAESIFELQLNEFDSRNASIVEASLRVLDDVNQGDSLFSYLEHFFVDYESVWTTVQVKYGAFVDATFEFELKRSVIERSATVASQDISTDDSGTPILQPKLVELNGLVNNIFQFNTQSILTLPFDANIELRVPEIGAAIARCSDADKVTAIAVESQQPLELTYDRVGIDLSLPLALDLLNADGIFDSLSDFQNGRELTLCVVQHPRLTNFVSQFLASVDLRFVVEAGSALDSPSDVAGDELRDQLEVAITGEESRACLNLDLDLAGLDSDDEETIVFRWGDINLVFGQQEENTDFFTVSLPGAVIGGGQGSVEDPLQLGLCLISDDALTLDQGASLAGATITSIVELEPLALSVVGTVAEPGNPSNANPVNANFAIPSSAYDAIFGDDSQPDSDQSPPVEVSLVQLKEVVDDSVVAISVSGAIVPGIISETDLKLTVPDLGLAVNDCSQNGYLASVFAPGFVASSGALVSSTTNLDLQFALGDASAIGDALKKFRQSDEALKVCLSRPDNIPNFLSRVLGSSAIEFDISSEDEEPSESLIKAVSLEMVSAVDRTCLDISANLDSFEFTKVEWGTVEVSLGLQSTPNVAVSTLTLAASALLPSTDENTVTASICVVAGDTDVEAGASRVRDLVQAFLDKVALGVELSGTVQKLGEEVGLSTIQSSFIIPASLWEGIVGPEDSSGEDNSVLQDLSVSLESLVNNNVGIQGSTLLDFDIGFETTITFPTISFEVAVCTEPSILSIIASNSASSWTLGTPPSALGLDLLVTIPNGDAVVDALQRYSDGLSQSLCIVSPANEELNSFLIQILQLVDLDISFDSSTADDTSSTSFEIDIESDGRSACASVPLATTIESSNITLSWPQLALEVSSRGDVSHILELSLPSSDSSGSSLIPNICVLAPNGVSVESSVENVQTLLNKVSDREQIGFVISGTIGDASASALFDVPLGAYDLVSEDDPNSPALLELNFVEPTKLVDTTLGVAVDATLNLGQSVTLAVPKVSLAVIANVENGADVLLASVTAEVPQFVAGSDPIPLQAGIELTLESWDLTFKELERLVDQDRYNVTIAGPESDELFGKPVNYLSRLIPSFEFAVKGGESGEEVPTTPSIGVAVQLDSDDSMATIKVSTELLEELGLGFKWGSFAATLGDGTESVATVSIPAPDNGILQPIGSEVDVSLIFSGDAAVAVGSNILRGKDDMLLELKGQFEGSPESVDLSLTIPKRFLGLLRSSDAPVEEETADNTTAITFSRVALLGGDDIGTDVVFPCILDAICQNTVKTDADLDYTGITLGLGVQLDLGSFGRVDISVELLTDLWLALRVNGLGIGQLRVKNGITLASGTVNSEPVPLVMTFVFPDGSVDNVRAAANLFVEGLDSVISITGSETQNYISRLISALNQDFDLLADESSDGDEESALGGLDIGLANTVKETLTLLGSTQLSFTEDFFSGFVDLGSVEFDVWYAHNDQGVGRNVLWGLVNTNDVDSLGNSITTIRPQPEPQSLSALVNVGYREEADRDVMDTFISGFVWGYEYALEAKVRFQPSVDVAMFDPKCQDRAACSFELHTYLTVPESFEESGFIEAFSVSLGDSIGSIIAGDFKLEATKTLRNTFGWDVVLSHFSYKIDIFDTDGVRQGDCGINSGGLFGGGIGSPCGSGFCYDPFTEPTNVLEDDSALSLGPLDRPLQSLLSQGWFRVGDTGDVDLTLDLSTATASRMYDDFYVNEELCANIVDGLMIVAMQSDELGCTDDANMTRDDMTCTFVTYIPINLYDFVLAGNGTCGKGFKIRSSDGFTGLAPDGRDYGMNGVFMEGSNQRKARWYVEEPLKVNDIFRFEFTMKIDESAFWGHSRALALVFKKDRPESTTSPVPTTEDNDDNWGFTENFGESMAIHFAWDRCNSLAIFKNGRVTYEESLHRSMSMVGEEIDSGDDTNWRITYDGYMKRLLIEHLASPPRSIEWDVDLAAELGSDTAYLGFTGNTMSSTNSRVQISDFRGYVVRTDSRQYIRDPDSGFSLPRKGELSELIVRARDPQTRHRGDGGDDLRVEILPAAVVDSDDDPVLEPLVIEGCACAGTICVCDNGDGSYTVRYVLGKQGRYVVRAWCASDNCVNQGDQSEITDRLYVRKLEGAADPELPALPDATDAPSDIVAADEGPENSLAAVVGGAMAGVVTVSAAVFAVMKYSRNIRRHVTKGTESDSLVPDMEQSVNV